MYTKNTVPADIDTAVVIFPVSIVKIKARQINFVHWVHRSNEKVQENG